MLTTSRVHVVPHQCVSQYVCSHTFKTFEKSSGHPVVVSSFVPLCMQTCSSICAYTPRLSMSRHVSVCTSCLSQSQVAICDTYTHGLICPSLHIALHLVQGCHALLYHRLAAVGVRVLWSYEPRLKSYKMDPSARIRPSLLSANGMYFAICRL